MLSVLFALLVSIASGNAHANASTLGPAGSPTIQAADILGPAG